MSVRSDKYANSTSLALLVIVIGVLMAAIDTTIVVLALPEIEKSLKVPLSDVIWVIISYLLVITILSAQVGKLGDMYGRVKSYQTGFIIFIVGSGLCALAFNEISMVMFRVIQGVGGALIAANSGAVIADTFPPEKRGRAFGFNAIGWNVGAIAGILIGGLIINYVSWRWIFWIKVPTGIFSYILSLYVLRDRGVKNRQKLDLAGMITLALGLFCVLWAITKLASESFNLTIDLFLGSGIVLIIVFGLIETHHSSPMLNFKIFKIPTVTPTLLASMFQAVANFAVLFLIIMYLQGVRNLSPLTASMLLIPGYIIGGISAPIAGRLSDKVGPILPATVGLGIQIIALLTYAQLTTKTPYALIVVAAIINGIGGGGFFPSNTAAIMKAVPQEFFGIASGVLRTFANVGMIFSFAIALLIAGKAIPKGLAFAIFVGTKQLNHNLASAFTVGIHAAFYGSVAFMAVAALLSATRILHLKKTQTPNTEFNKNSV